MMVHSQDHGEIIQASQSRSDFRSVWHEASHWLEVVKLGLEVITVGQGQNYDHV